MYYQPRRATKDPSSLGGRQAYFATARVVEIIRDPTREDHFYALMPDYLEFDQVVPFKDGVHYYESALLKEDGSTNKGAFGRAVRNMPDQEYELILRAGFAHIMGNRERPRPYPDVPEEPLRHQPGLAEERAPFEPGTLERPLVTQILQRPFRDRAFASAIKTAYHDTCAVTGIKIINGGGRSEVQAAHIRPVADRGPDSIRNGVALSGTVHWMFDRGLISAEDDYDILVARDRIPEVVLRLISPSNKLLLPERPECRPHPQFLKYHREQVFKG